MSVTVPPERAEQARAVMIQLFTAGFEERDLPDGLEFSAYTDHGGEERLWQAFGGVRGTDVEAGWEDRWRSFHTPSRVGPVWIGPPWETPPGDAIAVVIDPGRAFGTGAHPTTRLSLQLLLDVPRSSLLDVGCGSGVLSIAAAKLGFGPVTALDAEPEAIEATLANAQANGVEVETRLADARVDSLPRAEAAVANIALVPLGTVLPRLRCERAVTSGYLAAHRPPGRRFRPVKRAEEEGWAADLWEREKGLRSWGFGRFLRTVPRL